MPKKVTNDVEILEDDKPQVINADLRKFNRTEQMVLSAVTALSAITVIESQEQLDHAMQVLKEAKTVENKIEARRKELVKPFNDAVKKINDHAKAIVITLPIAIDSCKKVVLAFQKKEEERVRKESYERRVQALVDRGFSFNAGRKVWVIHDDIEILDEFILYADTETWNPFIQHKIEHINERVAKLNQQTKADAEDDAMFGTDDEVLAPTLERQELSVPVAAPVQEAAKVKGITKRWVFAVEDVNKLPKEYLQVNETAIREAIKGGTRLIPGVRIYQEESLTIR